jgi:hypothetical protein
LIVSIDTIGIDPSPIVPVYVGVAVGKGIIRYGSEKIWFMRDEMSKG